LSNGKYQVAGSIKKKIIAKTGELLQHGEKNFS